ncbi:MAG: dienelactone hydrolase family protein [Bacteroidales bacterium]|jgi:carboxymethylenebutenolidase
MDQRIRTLYSDYKKGGSDRRSFIRKLAVYTGGAAAAMAMMPHLEEEFEKVNSDQQVDPDLNTEFINYPGETGQIKAYLAWPKTKGKYPAVLVIHENRGLQPHIMDVTRRMAREGFLTMSPDALSPLGGTPEGDLNKVVDMIKQLDPDKTVKNFVDAVKYLETNPLSTGKVGCTGFCWGGGMTNQVAVNEPTLKAAVPYYGKQPASEDVPKIKAALMAHYAENDSFINPGIPAFEEALKKSGIEYHIYTYPGTQHAFNNDTSPERYNEQAAKLAWKRTVDFFREKLT